MKKSIEELKKIKTKNLLRFCRAERDRMFKKGYRWVVIDDDKNDNIIMGWTNDSNSETFDDDVNFLSLIKTELDTRENVN
jgi:hypothetical protein